MAAERIHVHELIEPVPRGGPGRVWRARTVESGGPVTVGTLVALRVLDEAEAGGPAGIERLLASHAAARRIRSPAVLTPLDFGVVTAPEGRRFWSASRWVDARPLTAVLAEIPSFPVPLADALVKQAAAALVEVHRAGLHAIGLSPDSLLVQADSSMLLADPALGPAHAATWPATGSAPPAMACAAPEVLAGAPADGRADLFSLGAMLHRAMTGEWHRPVDGAALREDAANMPARRPGDVRPRTSIFLDEIVFTLLQPDAAQRFASAAALREVLDQRRDSAWWKSLQIAQETFVGEGARRALAPAEPPPDPIPGPAPAPDAAWFAPRRARRVRLGIHRAPLIGRADELNALLDTATRLGERGGEVLLLQGEGGAGKTRLLDALIERLQELPPDLAPFVLAGDHRRLGIGRPLRAFSEALTGWIAGERDVVAADVAPLLGDAVAVAPAFAAFLSGGEPPERSLRLTQDVLAASFARVLQNLAAQAPVVLVVESLQWADPEGLDLFGYLARLVADLPVLLVGTYRPVRKQAPLAHLLAALRAHDHVTHQRVEALDAVATAKLTAELVTPEAAALAFGARLHAATGGNPLLVLETLRVLEQDGVLQRDDLGRFVASERLAAAALPSSEDEVFRRRVGSLPAPERQYLAMAAVQGVAFDPAVARVALGHDEAQAARELSALERGGFVEGLGAGRRFANTPLFDHVHDALDDATLERCHEATANAFLATRNPEGKPPSATHGILSYRVAWHYLLAGRNARGLLYVAPALEHLRATWRLGDAERLADLAARALAGDAEQGGPVIDLLLERAEILGLQGRRVEERELLDDALLRARDRQDRAREARALLASSRLRAVTNQLSQAREEGRETLSVAHDVGEERVETHCHALLGTIAFREARYQDARRHMNEALELSRRRQDADAQAEALQTLGTISQSVGSFEHAEELHREAMSIYRRSGDLAHEADALTSLGNIAASGGDLVKSEGYLRRALAIERALGNGFGEARVLGHLGMVLQDGGRYPEAREAHAQCLSASRRMGARQNEIVAELNLATADYVLGRLEDARSSYGEAMRNAREVRDLRLQGYALTGLAEVARQRGEWDIAQSLLERAMQQFRRVEDTGGLAAALLAAGRVEVLRANPAHARSLLDEAVEVATAQHARVVAALGRAWRGLLLARTGSSDAAHREIAEAGLLLEEVRTGDLARTEVHFLHALVLRIAGRRVEADRKVVQAERVLLETTLELPAEDRDRLLRATSPAREIMAGAAAARLDASNQEAQLSDTRPV